MPDDLSWNGGIKPKPPAEGFATDLSVGIGATGSAALSSDRPRESLIEAEEGLNLKVKRLGVRSGPEVVRPSGRVRMKST